MFDIVIKRVTGADALERKPSRRLISSVRAACVAPNLRLMCVSRKDPKASAANSGIVIIHWPHD